MSGWRRCAACRKVRAAEEFPPEGEHCLVCLTAPAPRRRAAPVTRSVAPTAPAPSAAPTPRTGSVGSGDLEVRERRARRSATEALVEAHAEEFDALLRTARRAEGLRTSQ